MEEDKNIVIRHIIKCNGSSSGDIQDFLAVESPIEVQLTMHGQRPAKSIAVIMRTPGQDRLLALGFLFTEGIIKGIDVVESVSYPAENVIRVVIKKGVQINIDQIDRHFYTSSSCGVCSKASIEAIHTNSQYQIKPLPNQLDRKFISQLLKKVDGSQSLFEKTGGIHAAALFNMKGEIEMLCEDVGRHNALDKLLGWALDNNLLPLRNHIVFLSGRASFELIQKTFMAAVPVIVAVGAPSSLAVELAESNGQTLIGFLKANSLNIYCGKESIQIG